MEDYKEKYEQAFGKAKAYDEAIERAKKLQHDNAWVTSIFPELKESEDEKIKKELLHLISYIDITKENRKRWISWLEAKGEQKPAWSEEYEDLLNNIEESLLAYKIIIMDNDTELANYIEKEINFLKSLKDRHIWRPSDEQMDALNDVISSRDIKYDVLSELWEDLKKLREE